MNIFKFFFMFLLMFFIIGCAFLEPSAEPYYSSKHDSKIEGVITKAKYANGRYSYEIKGVNLFNDKLSYIRAYSDNYFYGKGDKVYAVINGNRVKSMKLLKSINLTSRSRIETSKEHIRNKNVSVPISTHISF